MKNCCWLILIAVAVLLSACSGLGKKHNKNRFGSGAGVPNNVAQQDNQYVNPSPTDLNPTDSSAADQSAASTLDQSGTTTTMSSTTTNGQATTQAPSYASPVPGKAGLVTSPFAPYAGYVDVRGYAPGQEVKCPYTGKLFRVP